VESLKKELESTFKEEISVYFDINLHDGLLETHDVDASLREKLICLIFIPVLSRTYCDPKSFAWVNEFITLNHNKVNQISDSNFDENRKWNGLSPFGLEVIKEMNRLGVMIDISHSTDSTVFQSLRYSVAPIIASHSSCRHFTPGLETIIKS